MKKEDNAGKRKPLRFFTLLGTAVNIISLLIYLTFLGYKLVKRSGNFALNAALAAFTAAYLIFLAVIAVAVYSGRGGGKVKKNAAFIYKITKLVTLLLAAVMAVYGILTAKGLESFFTLLFAVLNTASLVIQLVLAVVVKLISVRLAEMKNSVSARFSKNKKHEVVAEGDEEYSDISS